MRLATLVVYVILATALSTLQTFLVATLFLLLLIIFLSPYFGSVWYHLPALA